MKRHLLTATLLGGALFAQAATASDLTPLSDKDRQTLHAEIKAYILENPEVLVEAMQVLDQRQAEAQQQNDIELVAQHSDAIFNDDYSWVGGNPDGDITLVEFMDYRCGYCRRAYGEVEKLIESDGNIRFIVKEFPILGEASEQSARFAMATKNVAGDEAYKSVHDALIELKGEPNEDTLRSIAEALSLDADAILAGMNSDEVNSALSETMQLARELAISGTPTFVLGDNLIRGYVPLAEMERVAVDIREAN